MRKIMRCVNTRLFVVFLLIIVTFVCGCQQTPETEVVVNAGNLEEKIKGSTADVGVYSVPDNWKESLHVEGREENIEIDAVINLPDVEAFPVYKVSKAQFDTSQVESLVSFFTKGSDVNKFMEPTKADLQKHLIIARKDNDEVWAAELERMINAAPETVPKEIITDWNPAKSPSGGFLVEDDEYAGIGVCSDIFSYMNGFVETEDMCDEGIIIDPKITVEEAVGSAQIVLRELGVNYMVLDSFEKARRYSCFSNNIYAEYSEKPASKGYFLKFARQIDGIASIIDKGLLFSIKDEFAYSAPLYPEEIRIFVDEAGKVQLFEWMRPLMIEDRITENAELMPFDEMKQRICDMLTFINSYNSGTIKVTSIDMHITIVDMKDHPGEAMYVPAWFINYLDILDDSQQENVLVLNAIDGGRVLERPADISTEIQQAMDEDKANLIN